MDKSHFEVFTSFEQADEADRQYWWSRTPQERLTALEVMRQVMYSYDPATTRLQRVLEVAELERG